MTRELPVHLPRRAMNAHVRAIYNQIGPVALARMGATTFSLDNRKNALQWKMKRGQFTSIRVECQPDGAGYQVSFFIINRQQFIEIVIEPVAARELTSTIEQMNDVQLSSKHISATLH